MESSNQVQVQDDFLSIGIELIKKKVELEAVTEELESAKYTEAHPNEDLYNTNEDLYNTNDSYIIEEIVNTRPTIQELKTTKTELETQLVDIKTKYIIPSTLEGKQNDMITFNNNLDLYISNKKKIREVKKEIETKMVEILKIMITLNKNMSDIQTDPSTTFKEWDNNFKIYYKKYLEVFNLFDRRETKDLIIKNNNLFRLLTTSNSFIKLDDINHFYKAIIQITFDEIKKNLERILDEQEYTEFKEFEEHRNDPSFGKVTRNKQKSISHLNQQNRVLRENIKTLRVQLENEQRKHAPKTEEFERRIGIETQRLKSRIKELEKIRESSEEEKSKIVEGYEKRLQELEKQIEEKYARQIESLTDKNKSITQMIVEPEDNELQRRIKENELIIEELKEKSKQEKDELKIQIDLLKSYVSKNPEELQNTVEQLQFQRALIEARANGESDDFLSMLIKSADLYGKPEFQDSFDKLLKYQPEEENPEDKFMFAYVFNEIETNKTKYDYLEDFTKQYKIPEQIEQETLLSQIMETSFKSSPQTRL